MAADGFRYGSTVFQCGICQRKTRRTAKQQNDDLCPQCDQWSMTANGISDGGYEGKALAQAEATILKLKEKAASLGGNREALDLPAAA